MAKKHVYRNPQQVAIIRTLHSSVSDAVVSSMYKELQMYHWLTPGVCMYLGILWAFRSVRLCHAI